MKKFSPSPEYLGVLNDEVRRGVGAGTLISVLDPVLDRRLEQLLAALESAEPELNRLLDLRAKIASLRALKRELAQAAQTGHEAGEKLNQL